MQKRVLLVEDDPAVAKVVVDNLRFEGYEVAWAAEGHAAVTLVRQLSPDLILLDLMLPDCDGLELCGMLRQSGRVPIIILSARSQKVDKLKGLRAGGDDYLTKPFDLDELLARIQAVLRRTPSA